MRPALDPHSRVAVDLELLERRPRPEQLLATPAHRPTGRGTASRGGARAPRRATGRRRGGPAWRASRRGAARRQAVRQPRIPLAPRHPRAGRRRRGSRAPGRRERGQLVDDLDPGAPDAQPVEDGRAGRRNGERRDHGGDRDERDDQRQPTPAGGVGRSPTSPATRGATSGASGQSTAGARALSSRSRASSVHLPDELAEPVERARRPRLDGAAAHAEVAAGLLLAELGRKRWTSTSRSRSSRRASPSSSSARRSCATAAVSGDGAASPETAAACSASSARRPADRRRFRASFATMRRSHGRNGAPARNRRAPGTP